MAWPFRSGDLRSTRSTRWGIEIAVSSGSRLGGLDEGPRRSTSAPPAHRPVLRPGGMGARRLAAACRPSESLRGAG